MDHSAAAPPPRSVLVTGVSGLLGQQVAERLAEYPCVERVVAVDSLLCGGWAAPGVEFVRADIRNPLIAKVIATAEVDTVVHAALASAPGRRSVGTDAKEMNVLGSMQLLAACQQAPTMRRLVVTSTAAVYGSGPRDPAVFTEQMEASGRSGGAFARDAAEVEEYVRGFARRREDVAVSVLRLADVVGSDVHAALRRFLTQSVVPTVFGSDPRFQLLHAQDAVSSVVRATLSEVNGIWNVAGAGVLTMAQALRRAGRISVPVPSALTGPLALLARGTNSAGAAADRIGLPGLGRVVDTSAVERELGFTPRWTTVQAFDDFVTTNGVRGVLKPEWVGGVERGALAVAGWLS